VEIFPEVTIYSVPLGPRITACPSLSKGVTLGISMICLENPSNNPVYDPNKGVYGLLMGVGYIWNQQPNFHDENL
jgi:hypothetical protein